MARGITAVAAIALLCAPRALGQTAPGLPLAPAPNATISADITHYEESAKHWVAAGHVRITHKQYVLTGDAGDFDETTSTAILRGNVALDTGKETVSGGADSFLEFNIKTREWSMSKSTTDVTPVGALSPFHVMAESIKGSRREITLYNAHITSCDPVRPQYEVVAREVTILPDRKVIARHATTLLFGRRLATVPTLVFPIKQQGGQAPVVPVVGQSTEEGFFLKTLLNYARGGQTGAVHVDVMQKQGLGLGVTHDYAPNGKGEVSLYSVTGQAGRNLSANLRDNRKILGFDTQLEGELRKNSYLYVPGSTSRSAGISMARAVGASDTRLSLRYNGSKSGGGKYQGVTAGFAQAYKFDPKGTLQFGVDSTRQSSAGIPATSEVDHKISVAQGFNAVDVELAANHIAVHGGGETGGLYLPVQRLPELTLKSDAYRLGLTASKSAPVALTLADGSFEANGHRGGRQLFEATAPNRRWKAGSLTLNVGGGFRQAIYTSDAALYTLTGNLGVTQPLGRKSDFTLSYSVSKPKGYTPFQFDRPFAYESLSGTVKLADMRALELRAGTAYDFRNHLTPWRDLLAMAIVQPTPGIRWVTNAAINVNGKAPGETSKVRYVNSGLRLRLGGLHFDGEGRYIPATGRFGRLLGSLDTPVGRDWRVRALAGTDSGQRYRHFLVAKDMGCTEASVALINDKGWRNETGIRVLIRIKAFPMADPFTTGMFGENLNIGGGDLQSSTASSLPPGF
ncbi:MAG TPA: hypothetical protein VGM51_00935 [Armatimonadota bacterium]|jgi:hypothetical protein